MYLFIIYHLLEFIYSQSREWNILLFTHLNCLDIVDDTLEEDEDYIPDEEVYKHKYRSDVIRFLIGEIKLRGIFYLKERSEILDIKQSIINCCPLCVEEELNYIFNCYKFKYHPYSISVIDNIGDFYLIEVDIEIDENIIGSIEE